MSQEVPANAATLESTDPVPVDIEGKETETQETESPNKKESLTPPDGGWTEVPSFYDPSKHSPLKKKDFADPRVWHRWQISQAEEAIEKHNKAIEMFDKFGTDPDSLKKAKTLNRSMENLSKIAEDLPEDVDLEALMGELMAKISKNKEARAAASTSA